MKRVQSVLRAVLPHIQVPDPSSVTVMRSRRGHRFLRGVLAFGVLWAGLVAGAFADATLDLPVADRRAIEGVAGAGIIAGTLPASHLADPGKFFASEAVPRTFRVRDGDGGEVDESYQWEPSGNERAKPTWRYRAGDNEIGFVERDADGSYVLSGIEDLKEKALTRYRPAEPLLLKGMMPGEERKRRIDVRVYDPGEPAAVVHQGTLEVAHRYLGAYRINTPSGVYDTILTKSVFDGAVGPAHLRDIQYRFFGKGVGIVATVEIRDVTAAVVYHSATRVARLLSTVPHPQVECSGAELAAAAETQPPTHAC